MSCHGCASKFTLFNKELCCPSCGFSYCSKCLKYKAVVPKLGEKEHKICKSCFNAITDKSDIENSTRKEYCPPDSFLKRMESLENPARPPITMYRQDSRLQQLKAGLNETDRQIAERLEKLKEERKKGPVPTDEEVVRRLALLKGENPERMAELAASKKTYIPPDTRSSQEKSDDLIQQFMKEEELKSRLPDPAEEIAQRLAKLRGQETSSSEDRNKKANVDPKELVCENEECFGDIDLDSVAGLIHQLENEVAGQPNVTHSPLNVKLKLASTTSKEREEEELIDEEEIEETVKKVLEAAALEAKSETEEIEGNGKKEEENSKYCSICSEYAVFRCIDCNDLYCNECIEECHDEWEKKNHHVVPFTQNRESI